jgi:hypothetical protein
MSKTRPSWWRAEVTARGQTLKGQTLWLSALIGAMENFSRSEWRSRPVDRREVIAVRRRLAQPAMAHEGSSSRFGLRR